MLQTGPSPNIIVKLGFTLMSKLLHGWAVRRDEDLCLDARKLEMAAGAGAAEAGAGLWKCRDCRRPALVSTQHYIRSFIASTSTMPTRHQAALITTRLATPTPIKET